MGISADIKAIKYKPLLCRNLQEVPYREFSDALASKASFILNLDGLNRLAVSWWVSAKRTRSYPYARIYDCLSFAGKKITIIPVFKDEGLAGDRDFLQWDTVALMSLLGVYVVISYYKDASPSSRYKNKISEQRFDLEQLDLEVHRLLSYHSDALHWNLIQVEQIGITAKKALKSYMRISKKLGIAMHSRKSAETRIARLLAGKQEFMRISRGLAKEAQYRESVTVQPRERVNGSKGTLTIKNFLGGYYFFTCDELEVSGNKIYLVEAKHTETNKLPSSGDIKDGLLKMMLFTNLVNVKSAGRRYDPFPMLRLTSRMILGQVSSECETSEFAKFYKRNQFTHEQTNVIDRLNKEAKTNGFKLVITGFKR